MGYTHYVYRKEILGTPEKFKAMADDCSKVVSHLCRKNLFRVQFESDQERPPVFDSDLVRLNGRGSEGHETYFLEREFSDSYKSTDENGRFFQFCKTELKPYDAAVCTCLIVLKHHFGEDVAVTSDGTPGKDQGWIDGAAACQELFGYGFDFQLDRE